jgi:hypothetical protein
MKTCSGFDCIDLELPLGLLAERCTVSARYLEECPEKVVLTLTCRHGHSRRHTVYRGGSEWDWAVALAITCQPRAAA